MAAAILQRGCKCLATWLQSARIVGVVEGCRAVGFQEHQEHVGAAQARDIARKCRTRRKCPVGARGRQGGGHEARLAQQRGRYRLHHVVAQVRLFAHRHGAYRWDQQHAQGLRRRRIAAARRRFCSCGRRCAGERFGDLMHRQAQDAVDDNDQADRRRHDGSRLPQRASASRPAPAGRECACHPSRG